MYQTDNSNMDHALALVCSSKHIQQEVKKFNDDNPNCDEWLPELLELWEKTRKRNKNKDKPSKSKSSSEDGVASKPQAQPVSPAKTQKASKSKQLPESAAKFAVSPKK